MERFRAQVTPQFVALLEARQAKRAGDEEVDVRNAWRAFEVAVTDHWPYAAPERRPGAKTKYSESWEEFLLTKREVRRAYWAGQLPREQAVGRLLEIAERWPESEAAHAALFHASILYTQHPSFDSDDLEAAEKLRKRLADSDRFSSWVISAKGNLTGHIDSDDEQFKARSEMVGWLTKLQDPTVLAERALRPLPSERPSRFVYRMNELISIIRKHDKTNAVNVVADAVQSEDPIRALNWLKRQYPSHERLQREIAKALRYVGLTRYDVDFKNLEDELMDSVDLESMARVEPDAKAEDARAPAKADSEATAQAHAPAHTTNVRAWLAALFAGGAVIAIVGGCVLRRRKNLRR